MSKSFTNLEDLENNLRLRNRSIKKDNSLEKFQLENALRI